MPTVTVSRDAFAALREWKKTHDYNASFNDRSTTFVEHGGVDGPAFRHIAKGGIWNANLKSTRAALGLTEDDVTAVRDMLARVGEKVTRAVAEDMAAMVLSGTLTRPTDTTAAQRKRAQRARARAAGRCIVNPAHEAPQGRATCDACNAAAHVRQSYIAGKVPDPALLEESSDEYFF